MVVLVHALQDATRIVSTPPGELRPGYVNLTTIRDGAPCDCGARENCATLKTQWLACALHAANGDKF